MTAASLRFMAFVGLIALAIGGGLLIVAARRRREASRYAARLAAVMVAAVGLILIVFALSYIFYS